MKKIISILLVVLMLGGSFAMCANAVDNLYTEKEANNTLKEAFQLNNDYTVSGVVADKDDLDYYKITLSKETQVSFLCQSRYSTVAVSLRDASNNVLLNAESTVTDDNYYDIIVTTLAKGTYYFVVSQHSTYSNVPYLFLFYYEEIKSANHTHKYVVTKTNPTCTEPSYKTYYCACKFNFVTAGDPPTGHWESTWLDIDHATCKSEGSKYKRCITCGANLGFESTPKTAHTDKNADGWCDTCDLTYDDCSCLCHRDDLIGVFFNAILKILKVFKIAETCACGFAH